MYNSSLNRKDEADKAENTHTHREKNVRENQLHPNCTDTDNWFQVKLNMARVYRDRGCCCLGYLVPIIITCRMRVMKTEDKYYYASETNEKLV